MHVPVTSSFYILHRVMALSCRKWFSCELHNPKIQKAKVLLWVVNAWTAFRWETSTIQGDFVNSASSGFTKLGFLLSDLLQQSLTSNKCHYLDKENLPSLFPRRNLLAWLCFLNSLVGNSLEETLMWPLSGRKWRDDIKTWGEGELCHRN